MLHARTLTVGISALAAIGAVVVAGLRGDTRLRGRGHAGRPAAVRSLLGKKSTSTRRRATARTALHWAAFRDDLEMVKMLIAAGANVKAATREGDITPLFMACANGRRGHGRAAAQGRRGCQSVKSNGTTALMTAAASGSADAVKMLLDHGANVNAKERCTARRR